MWKVWKQNIKQCSNTKSQCTKLQRYIEKQSPVPSDWSHNHRSNNRQWWFGSFSASLADMRHSHKWSFTWQPVYTVTMESIQPPLFVAHFTQLFWSGKNCNYKMCNKWRGHVNIYRSASLYVQSNQLRPWHILKIAYIYVNMYNVNSEVILKCLETEKLGSILTKRTYRTDYC